MSSTRSGTTVPSSSGTGATNRACLLTKDFLRTDGWMVDGCDDYLQTISSGLCTSKSWSGVARQLNNHIRTHQHQHHTVSRYTSDDTISSSIYRPSTSTIVNQSSQRSWLTIIKINQSIFRLGMCMDSFTNCRCDPKRRGGPPR